MSEIKTEKKIEIKTLVRKGKENGYVLISEFDEITKELILPDKKHIAIKPLAWFHLDKYLNTRHDNSPWLFINLDRAKKADDNNLSVRSVERIIERYAKLMIPILKINPQILRNTLAHTLKLEGAQKENIRTSLHFKTKTGADNYLKKI